MALEPTAIFPFLFSLDTKNGNSGHDNNPLARCMTASANWRDLEPTKGDISGFTSGVFETTSLPDAHNNGYKILLRIRAVTNGPIGSPAGGVASWMFTHGTAPVVRLQLKNSQSGVDIYAPTWFRRNNAADTSYDNYRTHRNDFFGLLANYLDGTCPLGGHKRSAHIYFVPIANGDVGTEMWTGYGSGSIATYNQTQYATWGTETQRIAALKTSWKESIADFASIFGAKGIRISLGGGSLFTDGQNSAFEFLDDAAVLAANPVCMQTNLQVGTDGKTWRSFSARNADWALKALSKGLDWGFQTAGSAKLGLWSNDAQSVVNAFEDGRFTYSPRFIEGPVDLFNPSSSNYGDGVSRSTTQSPPSGHAGFGIEPDWNGGTVTSRQYMFTHVNNIQDRLITTPAPTNLTKVNRLASSLAEDEPITLANSAEGGDAFSTVVGSPVFSSTHNLGAIAPLTSMKVEATSAEEYVSWTTPAVTAVFGRVHLWMDANPSQAVQIVYGGTATRGFGIQIGTNGKIQMLDSTGFVQSLTATLPLGQWTRLEFNAVVATGALTVKLFTNAAATVPSETGTYTGRSIGTSFTSFRFGSSTTITAGPFWTDAVGITDLGWLGPLIEPVSAAFASSFDTSLATGTAITTDNSGGTVGTAFDVVVDAPIYSTVQAHSGTHAMRCATTTSAAPHVEWDTEPVTAMYLQEYVWFSANPAAAIPIISAHSTTESFRLQMGTNGKVQIFDSTGFISATNTAIALGSWVRLAAHVTAHATAGAVEVRLYNDPLDETPTEVLTASSLATGADMQLFKFGILPALGSVTAFYIDDLAMTTVGWPGPVAAGGGGIGEQGPTLRKRWRLV